MSERWLHWNLRWAVGVKTLSILHTCSCLYLCGRMGGMVEVVELTVENKIIFYVSEMFDVVSLERLRKN